MAVERDELEDGEVIRLVPEALESFPGLELPVPVLRPKVNLAQKSGHRRLTRNAKQADEIVETEPEEEPATVAKSQFLFFNVSLERGHIVGKTPIIEAKDIETRTHQPGVDALTQPPPEDPDALERQWAKDSANHKKVAWGWFVLIALLMTAGVTWSLTRLQKSTSQSSQILAQAEAELQKEAQSEQEAAQLISRVTDVAQRFLTAKSVTELLPLIRHPERVRPLLDSYYSGGIVPVLPVKYIDLVEPITLDKRMEFWVANVDQGQSTLRQLFVEIPKNGEPLVDWESWVMHQPLPWMDFVTKGPIATPTAFRVVAEVDHFYHHEFADASIWSCFRLQTLDNEEALFGYAKTDSAVCRELTALFSDPGADIKIPVILRLTIPEGLQSKHSVLIDQVLSPRWVYLDSPPSP